MGATLRNTRLHTLILLLLQEIKLDLAGGTKHEGNYYGNLKYFKNLNKKSFPLSPVRCPTILPTNNGT